MIIAPEERDDFERRGFLGPCTLCSPGEMQAIRSRIDALIEARRAIEHIASAVQPRGGDGAALETIYDAHLDDPDIHRLCTHPAIVGRAVDLLGPDLLLWRSTFWIKTPRARRVEWHQDTYKDEGFGWFPNVNAWIAIDDANDENCLMLVNGSHRRLLDLELFKEPGYVRTLQDSDDLPPPPVYSERHVTRMALAPGEFVVFDGRILHGSRPNRDIDRRAGLVARFVRAGTRLDGLRSPCMLVAGRDDSGHHELARAPA